MKIIIAPTRYKGSMTLKKKTDDLSYIIDKFPGTKIVDLGNDSIVDALTELGISKKIKVMINDPLFRSVEAEYGIIEDEKIAIIEIGNTSGINMLLEHERNPMNTTSFGTGEVIEDALDRGIRKFLIRLNDSAAIDGGIGILGALGVEFKDLKNLPVKLTGRGMFDIEDIDISKLDERAKESQFTIITKSNTQLSGLKGAPYSYAIDKGANKLMVVALDRGIRNYSLVLQKQFSVDIEHKEGAGAGGGIAGGLMTFLDSKFQKNVLIFKDRESDDYE